ncbi:TrkH family potassium uptake protein [Tessaracoccus antarcticus]|uniref:TrkH family potassium uptake protein n=2 Tax=Tessaracoccus antarcticus TaxID=2479848 RepID=A0A3M0GGA7_9ACTN|nr:TrkH family potassium uptake protein [Tessaracoccus antarcticus]
MTLPAGRKSRRRFLRSPGQVIVSAFALVVVIGTVMLMLPISRSGPGGAPFITALFTATSAVCVTGLITVDTATYWTGFGQVVIMALIQVGGLGIMALASLVGLLMFRRMGLRTRLTAAQETKSSGLGDVRALLLGVAKVSLAIEALVAILLTGRFLFGYGEAPGRALYLGVFHAVSAFNNAGFALYSNNLVGFATDPWVCLPIAAALILGGLGFPVLLELRRELNRPNKWSIHTRLTLSTYFALLVIAVVFVTANEWNNPATLGPLEPPGRLLAGFFQGVVPRTAGFNSLDYGQMKDGTILATTVLMFIGGGSAGTAGGIKVTTFIILLFVILAEVRGGRDVNIADRRIGSRVQRQALAVALLAVGLVMSATLLLLEITSLPLRDVLFETVSAFATVGLSTGITAQLPVLGQLVLAGMMFVGRLGPITLVSALALREKQLGYTLPEGRPLIG